MTGRRPGEKNPARGYGTGGGMLPTVELQGTMQTLQGATEVDVRLVRGRSARGLHRWAGLVVLALAGAAWVMFGSGLVWQRALVLGIGFLFLSPAVFMDVARALRERRERLDLFALMERVLGPVALDDVEHSPYRNPRKALPPGEPTQSST